MTTITTHRIGHHTRRITAKMLEAKELDIVRTERPPSTLLIGIYDPPEVRFTPQGQRLATFKAIGLDRLSFELWENEKDTNMHRREKPINELVALPDSATIVVTGYTKIREHVNKDGIKQRQNVFVVMAWKAGGW